MLAVVCTSSSDQSIPQLTATMTDYQTEINQLSSLVTSQVEFEQTSHENRAKNAQHALPCKQPRYARDLFTAYFNVFQLSGTVFFKIKDILYVSFNVHQQTLYFYVRS